MARLVSDPLRMDQIRTERKNVRSVLKLSDVIGQNHLAAAALTNRDTELTIFDYVVSSYESVQLRTQLSRLF